MSPRGGKRPGAGRKPTPLDRKATPPLFVQVDTETRIAVEERARLAGLTLAAYTRRALDVLAAVEDGAGMATIRRIAEASRE